MIDLKNIPGVPPEHADRYGQQFINLARKYSDEKDRNMSGTDAASPPLQPASKAQSSYFKTKDWDVVEIGSSDEESPSTNDGELIDDDEADEYDEDWNEEDFAAPASSGYFGGAATQSQAGPSPTRSRAAKKLTGKQLAWKMQFESQATQAAAVGSSKPSAKRASGGRVSGGVAWRGGRGGKKNIGKRRSSGTASAAGGSRTKSTTGMGKSKASGASSRSGAGGSGSGAGARSGATSGSGASARSGGGGARGGGGGGGSGAIRPMGTNFFGR